MDLVRRSFMFSFAERYTVLLLNTAGAMVIARALTPGEIGVYGVGAVMAGLAQSLRDFGVSQYVVQEKELNGEKLRAAFSASLLVAWLLAALLAASAAPLSAFYRQAQMAQVLHILALNFVLIPFGSVTLPYLRRQMRFGAIFLVNAAHCLTQLACELTMALNGWGSVSLAWGAVAGTVGSLIIGLAVRPADLPWLPGWRGISGVLSFGTYASAGGAVDELGVAAPDLIIGRVIGMAEVGIFGKAMGLINMFNQLMTSAISPVLFPLFSTRARDGGDLKAAYLSTASSMAALAWPFFAFLAVMAPELVLVLYGEQWRGAVPLIRIMCASSALYAIFNMARYLLVAMGQVRPQAALDTQASLVRVAAVLFAAPFGLRWVAWAVVIGALFRSASTYRRLSALIDLRAGELLAAVRRSAVVTVLSVLGTLSGQWLLPATMQSALSALLAGGVAAAALWLGAMFVMRHELTTYLWRHQ